MESSGPQRFRLLSSDRDTSLTSHDELRRSPGEPRHACLRNRMPGLAWLQRASSPETRHLDMQLSLAAAVQRAEQLLGARERCV